MIRIILNGANGRMGQAIAELCKASEQYKIVAGVDINSSVENKFPVYQDIASCDAQADVIIDFSNPACLSSVLDYAKKNRMPVVIATTGLSNEQKEELKKASETIPVFFSANMSLGVNLLIELVQKCAGVLGNDYDVEIVEAHHNQKLDAPSGTALAIADAISDASKEPKEYVYDRHSVRKKRERNEMGIHAIRGGTVVGEHSVLFLGQDETIEIRHSAASRRVFASGALYAGAFLKGKKPGFYSMRDLVL